MITGYVPDRHLFFVNTGNCRLMPCQNSDMNIAPIVIILSAVVLIGLIWAALRLTIRHDRAAIKGDMDEPHEFEKYDENWKDNG